MSEDIEAGTLPHVIETGENDIAVITVTAVEDPGRRGAVTAFQVAVQGARGVLDSPRISRRLGQSLVALGQDMIARADGRAPKNGTWERHGRGSAGR